MHRRQIGRKSTREFLLKTKLEVALVLPKKKLVMLCVTSREMGHSLSRKKATFKGGSMRIVQNSHQDSEKEVHLQYQLQSYH